MTSRSGVYIGGGLALTARHVLDAQRLSVDVMVAKSPVGSLRLQCPPILADNAEYDIAVLRVNEDAVPPECRTPIPLATPDQFKALLANQAQVTVVGFGCALSAHNTCLAGTKKKIEISILPANQGADIEGFDPDLEFIAGDPSGAGPFHATCKSDSGGPAFAWIDGVMTLVGITEGGENGLASSTAGCGAFRRSVFTRVDVYRDWILGAKCPPSRLEKFLVTDTLHPEEILLPQPAE